MPNLLSDVGAVIEDKLQCYICFEQVGDDVVETLCAGRHTFCFSCITQHVTSVMAGPPPLSEERVLPSCPVCRRGECSVTPSPFLATLSKLTGHTGSEEREDWLVQYKALLPRLRHNFRGVFCDEETREGIINCYQMRMFARYRTRSDSLLEVGSRLRRRNAGIPRLWASVAIDEESGVFIVSKHSSEAEATRVTRNTPSSFNRSFVVCMCGDNGQTVVKLQHKPVEIHMAVGVEIGNYFDTTMPGCTEKQSVINLLRSESNDMYMSLGNTALTSATASLSGSVSTLESLN